MKKLLILPLLIAFCAIGWNFTQKEPAYKEGDVILQTTSGSTGIAIQLATHSVYNHCGVLVQENGKWMVYEAVQPVCKTSLQDFNARGKGIVMRLKDQAAVTPDNIKKLKVLFKTYENKDYDLAFNWSDDKFYCSELVHKLYSRALGIELCKPRKLGDFDLSNKLVKEKLNEKYGNKIPLEEPMVAPSDLYNSTLLELVK
jgi:hypothetical protein